MVLTMAPRAAHALDPNQPATSYLRTTFTVEDGLSSNVVNAIVQTRNGFLWIGTDAGLDRFDGRHFTPIYFRGPSSTPQGTVSALAEGLDGDLWIGTSAGLVRIARPALDRFDRSLSVFYHPGSGMSDEITCLHVSRDGTLWVGTSVGLYRFVDNQFETVIPDAFISRIEDGADGHLLVVSGQEFVEPDGTRVIAHPRLAHQLGIGPDSLLFHVFQDHRGAVWFCTSVGLVRRVNGSIERFQPYGVGGHNGVLRGYEDPQGNLWVLALNGIFRVSGTKLEPLAPNTPLLRAVSADAEGNLWVGTNGEGLMRFKDRPIRMFTKADGLPSNIPMTVLSKRDGTLWVGNNCGGLSVFNGQRFKTYDERDGLSNSCVWALAEGKSGELWVGTWGGGLFRFADGHFVEFTSRQGLADSVVRAITIARDGSLWIATENGLSHMVNNQFHNYTTADGLSSNRIVSVYQDRHGTIWVGTSRGINRMTGDRFAPVLSPHEIFDPRYISLAEDSSGELYALSAPKGIDRIEENRLVEVDHDLDLLSMATSPSGELWFTGGSGIFRFSSTALSQNQDGEETPLDYARFGKADGMTSTQCSIGAPNMAFARDGKLWVATVQGLAMLDLPHLSLDTAKPRVFVEDVTVGRTRLPAGRELVLPPGTHHVELRFDSIFLTRPEKIRFQYRMDGVDPVWLEADNSHTAVYNNIPIGTHDFRIRATNSAGVWDRAGISFPVTQKPYFYETGWFRAICAIAFFLLLWSAYLLRVRHLRDQETKLRDVIETIPTFARTTLPDGSVDFVNHHWKKFTGLSTAETVGSGWQEAVHPEDLKRHAERWRASVATGEPFESEVRYRRADGQYRWFLSRAVPLRDGEGEIVKWYGVSTDIEDLKRAEAEIRALRDQLYSENLELRDEVDRASMFEEIVGTSKPLKAVLSRIAKVAPSDSTVLITGETGTGKELVARAVHKRSERSSRAFVSVNCAAIPRDLIASELFGHEKGAFTGATQRRLGRFELAEGGTIFLDEIGELPAETQIALLRVLQEHEFERVGGTGSIRANVRVIAATNRNLQASIAGGTFRSDLFYRLNVFPIEVPPLRERREDIPVLVEYFIDRYATKAGKGIHGINKKSLELLQSYPWPGNVRELQNVIERSVIVCDTENFSVDESWLSRQPLATEPNRDPGLLKRLPSQEKAIIEAALHETGGRVSGPSGAAAKLGIHRSTLDSKIRSLKINAHRFKTAAPPKSS